ncbi:MAG: peptidoglycan-binding domain-containing protein [Polyangiaceae bacterium]
MRRPFEMHRVQQGECIRSIAARHGIDDWQGLYNHDRNAELRRVRPDPHQLAPGDIVFVPRTEPVKHTFSSGGTRRFKANIPRVPLRVALKDPSGAAISGKSYKLKVGTMTFEGTTPGDGVVEHSVPALARLALLEVVMGDPNEFGGTVVLPIQIGHLDPVDLVSGAQSRLVSLGYACPVSGELDEDTRSALAQFQTNAGVEVTGELDAATRAALMDHHGGGSGH